MCDWIGDIHDYYILQSESFNLPFSSFSEAIPFQPFYESVDESEQKQRSNVNEVALIRDQRDSLLGFVKFEEDSDVDLKLVT